ncbi:MAG: hypothetical protein SFV15_11490 [Polyangiaceae bacterium]|nr:hypothetical protein [Polyangiaceae bacterium]
MSLEDPKELKRRLVQEGFQIYRTLADRVVLAERVRDNLIMESGVAAGLSRDVYVTVRAQRRDFPQASEAQLFEHARELATQPLGRGYLEHASNVVPVHDPGDPNKILDTRFEITLKRPIADDAELFNELRFLLSLKKSSAPDEG